MELIKCKEVRTKHSLIWIDKEGILWVRSDEFAEIDLEETVSCVEVYTKLGINKDNKVLQILDASGSPTITKEAKEYISEIGTDYFIASAIIGHSLAVRIAVNFFINFFKIAVPIKMFGSEQDALIWLREIKKNNKFPLN